MFSGQTDLEPVDEQRAWAVPGPGGLARGRGGGGGGRGRHGRHRDVLQLHANEIEGIYENLINAIFH